jgi:hypothetical protein
MEQFNFGKAIELVKAGKKVARIGWHGKRMFVFLNPGAAPASTQVECREDMDRISGINALLFETSDEGSTVRLPNINLKLPDGSIVTGWLASQNDLLAEDWVEA